MKVNLFKSWRGALLVAAIVTLGMSAYKVVFGPDAATRIAESRMARLLPGGQPTQEMMDRQITVARPFASAGITLQQLAAYMQGLNYEVTWEVVDVDVFVMRASGEDPLTRQTGEYAIQFVALAGPVRDGRVVEAFEGAAVGIQSMAYNHIAASDEEIVEFILQIVFDLSPIPFQ